MSGNFYSIKCPDCKEFGTYEKRTKLDIYRIKCRRCGKDNQARNALSWILTHFGPFSNPNEASHVTTQIQKQKGEIKQSKE